MTLRLARLQAKGSPTCGGSVEEGVRSPILSSWQRCRLLGLSPDQSELPYRQDLDLDGQLVHAARPVLDRLESRFTGSRMNLSLADGSGTVLQRRFGESSMVRHLAAIQSVPGFVFAEQFAGTNGIGLALAERRSYTSTAPNTSPSVLKQTLAPRFPFATRSVGASRASSSSAIRARMRTRCWTPRYARRPLPSNGDY